MGIVMESSPGGLVRQSFTSRAEWLEWRKTGGIGGSEAAAACGKSPWLTPVGLWRQKIGAETAKDLSGVEIVQNGVRMEPAIREMFKATHPGFTVEYDQFGVLYQAERPWLFATLDGELISNSGKRGILEIKTATPGGRAGWDKWRDGRIPENYYIQLLHQMLATGYDYAYLYAALFSTASGDITLREYEIHRADVEADMAWVLERETAFMRHVMDGTLPPTPLNL